MALLAMGWLVLGGAWSSDLGGDPDEAAHAVTALMVRDYLDSGFAEAPMRFARRYYECFPRVALGHYPPLFYLLCAPLLWLWDKVWVFWIFQASLLGAIAGRTARLGGSLGLPQPLSLAAGFLSAALPVMLKSAGMVMADLMLVWLILLAVERWIRWLQGPSWQGSLLWGGLAAAAILTKGSGILLAALPPLSLLLARRMAWFRDWRWWLSALPVIVLALPWMLWSAGISKEGMTGLSVAEFFVQACRWYPGAAQRVWGWPLILAALLGLAGLWPLMRRGLEATWAVLLSAMAGSLAVLLFIPVGLTQRYLMPLLPLVLLLAAHGVMRVIAAAKPSSAVTTRARQAALILVLLGAPMAALPRKEVHGFSEAVAQAARYCQSNGRAQQWLISSDPRGEGAVIAAAAFSQRDRPNHGRRVHRASQLLASSDWMGRGYQSKARDVASLLALLDRGGIEVVAVDESQPEAWKLPHHRLLQQAMAAGPWRALDAVSVKRQAALSPASSLRLFVRR